MEENEYKFNMCVVYPINNEQEGAHLSPESWSLSLGIYKIFLERRMRSVETRFHSMCVILTKKIKNT